MSFRVADMLAARVAAHPDAEAVVAPDARWTWRELDAQVAARAGSMAAMGLKRGDFIAILLPNGAEWVALFLAAARLGCITVPVNTRFKPAEIDDVLTRTDTRVTFTTRHFLGLDFPAMLGAAPHIIVEDQAWHAAPLPPLPDEHDPLLIQFTSGTTSRPKGVVLTQHAMLRNAASVAGRLRATPADRYLNNRPFFHVAGTTLTLLVCLCSGATLVTPTHFSAAEAARLLAEECCTLCSGNDTIFQMIMDEPSLDRARLALRGGWAAAGPVTMRRIAQELGAHGVCNAYGLSEAAPNVGFSFPDDSLDDRADGWLPTHDGLEVAIFNDDTRAAPDTQGEIRVRGWSLMQGYLKDPDNTAKTITPDGWLRTGDLGVMDARGRFRMVGRLKDVFRVGGENVAPAEVEEALQAHPDVAVAQVVGVPDARLGEVPAAFVRLAAGATITPDALLAWLRPRIAGFRLPRHLWFVDDFEAIGMTASGKVQKTKLREEAQQRLTRPPHA